jgi:hypothetical protein
VLPARLFLRSLFGPTPRQVRARDGSFAHDLRLHLTDALTGLATVAWMSG